MRIPKFKCLFFRSFDLLVWSKNRTAKRDVTEIEKSMYCFRLKRTVRGEKLFYTWKKCLQRSEFKLRNFVCNIFTTTTQQQQQFVCKQQLKRRSRCAAKCYFAVNFFVRNQIKQVQSLRRQRLHLNTRLLDDSSLSWFTKFDYLTVILRRKVSILFMGLQYS